jgi:hypothetical protein
MLPGRTVSGISGAEDLQLLSHGFHRITKAPPKCYEIPEWAVQTFVVVGFEAGFRHSPEASLRVNEAGTFGGFVEFKQQFRGEFRRLANVF